MGECFAGRKKMFDQSEPIVRFFSYHQSKKYVHKEFFRLLEAGVIPNDAVRPNVRNCSVAVSNNFFLLYHLVLVDGCTIIARVSGSSFREVAVLYLKRVILEENAGLGFIDLSGPVREDRSLRRLMYRLIRSEFQVLNTSSSFGRS